MEGTIIGSAGVRDALFAAKVIPITIRTINKFSDAPRSGDPAGVAQIVSSAVSYIRSIHGTSKISTWIAHKFLPTYTV